jgi:tetratricopeptide (TPR) repeat protein
MKKKFLRNFVLPALFVLVCVSCTSNAHFREGWYAEDSRNADGDTMYQNKQTGAIAPPDYDRAIQEYTAALAANEPAEMYIRYCLGLVYIAKGDIEKAEYNFSLLPVRYEDYLTEARTIERKTGWLGNSDTRRLLRGVKLGMNGGGRYSNFVTGGAFKIIAETYSNWGYYTQAAAWYEAHFALNPEDQTIKDSVSFQKTMRLAAAKRERSKAAVKPAEPVQPAAVAPAPAKAASLAGTEWMSEKSGLIIKFIHFIDDTTWEQYQVAMFGNTDIARGTYTLSGDKLTMDGRVTTIYDDTRFQFPGDREVYLLRKTN